MGENPVLLPTFKGDGLQPGVTLDDIGTVYDRMESLDRLRPVHLHDPRAPRTQNPK